MPHQGSSNKYPQSDTNRPAQLQKMARSLKFWIYGEEELYYPCSNNKCADQLRIYCTADLRLCFSIGKYPVVSWYGSYVTFISELTSYKEVLLDMSLGCPGNRDVDCAHWDHTVNLYVCCDTQSPLCNMELGRWITPFRR